jgi:small-conductance mechanosensitive channel
MTGEVLGIGWMRTQMRAQDGSLIFVPNSRMLGFIFQNYSLNDPEAVLTVTLPIDRQADLERAERLALEAARQVLGLTKPELSDQGIRAHYTDLGAAAAQLTVTLRAHNHPAVPALRSAYLKAVNTALAQAGIKLV